MQHILASQPWTFGFLFLKRNGPSRPLLGITCCMTSLPTPQSSNLTETDGQVTAAGVELMSDRLTVCNGLLQRYGTHAQAICSGAFVSCARSASNGMHASAFCQCRVTLNVCGGAVTFLTQINHSACDALEKHLGWPVSGDQFGCLDRLVKNQKRHLGTGVPKSFPYIAGAGAN